MTVCSYKIEDESDWVGVTSGVTRDPSWVHIVIVHISDLDCGITSDISKIDNTKMERLIGSNNVAEVLQEGPHGL